MRLLRVIAAMGVGSVSGPDGQPIDGRRQGTEPVHHAPPVLRGPAPSALGWKPPAGAVREGIDQTSRLGVF
jgi:hypothetical protein